MYLAVMIGCASLADVGAEVCLQRNDVAGGYSVIFSPSEKNKCAITVHSVIDNMTTSALVYYYVSPQDNGDECSFIGKKGFVKLIGNYP